MSILTDETAFDSPTLDSIVMRIDVAAGALAVLAGVACMMRRRIDGFAPSWWIGGALVCSGIPGLANPAGPPAVEVSVACGMVAALCLAGALRSPDVDATLRPVRQIATALAAIAMLAFVVDRTATSVTTIRAYHVGVGLAFAALAFVAAGLRRADHTRPWGVVGVLTTGLALAFAVPGMTSGYGPLDHAGGAGMRLVTMAFPTVWAIAALQAAAALQRDAAYKEHLEHARAESRHRETQDRFAETLHEVRSTVVALAGGVRRLVPADPRSEGSHLARALDAEIGRLRVLVDDPVVDGPQQFGVREALEPLLIVSRSGGWPVSWDIPSDLDARGRAADLAQVVHGLLANATRHAAGTPIDVSAAAEAGYVVVRVGDRGPGVARAERDLVFERGIRGSRSAGPDGNGLGLYIARSIVREAGGDLWVEPRAGGGASFVVSLPAAHAAPRPHLVERQSGIGA